MQHLGSHKISKCKYGFPMSPPPPSESSAPATIHVRQHKEQICGPICCFRLLCDNEDSHEEEGRSDWPKGRHCRRLRCQQRPGKSLVGIDGVQALSKVPLHEQHILVLFCCCSGFLLWRPGCWSDTTETGNRAHSMILLNCKPDGDLLS